VRAEVVDVRKSNGGNWQRRREFRNKKE